MDIKKLKEHLENTPIEQLRKEWDEVKEWGNTDPKAKELAKLFAIPVVVGQSEQLINFLITVREQATSSKVFEEAGNLLKQIEKNK